MFEVESIHYQVPELRQATRVLTVKFNPPRLLVSSPRLALPVSTITHQLTLLEFWISMNTTGTEWTTTKPNSPSGETSGTEDLMKH